MDTRDFAKVPGRLERALGLVEACIAVVPARLHRRRPSRGEEAERRRHSVRIIECSVQPPRFVEGRGTGEVPEGVQRMAACRGAPRPGADEGLRRTMEAFARVRGELDAARDLIEKAAGDVPRSPPGLRPTPRRAARIMGPLRGWIVRSGPRSRCARPGAGDGRLDRCRSVCGGTPGTPSSPHGIAAGRLPGATARRPGRRDRPRTPATRGGDSGPGIPTASAFAATALGRRLSEGDAAAGSSAGGDSHRSSRRPRPERPDDPFTSAEGPPGPPATTPGRRSGRRSPAARGRPASPPASARSPPTSAPRCPPCGPRGPGPRRPAGSATSPVSDRTSPESTRPSAVATVVAW